MDGENSSYLVLAEESEEEREKESRYLREEFGQCVSLGEKQRIKRICTSYLCKGVCMYIYWEPYAPQLRDLRAKDKSTKSSIVKEN